MVAQPQQTFDGVYLHESLYAMAAAYLFHISQSQAFFDGNKRTAVLCSLDFLHQNRVRVAGGNDELVELVIAVAERRADKRSCADFFARRTISGVSRPAS